MAHVDGSGDHQPDVAIDARARIPARGRFLGHEAHGDYVFRAEFEIGREVELETAVAVRPAAEFMAVQPDGGVRHGAIELNGVELAFVGGGHGEVLAIPARAEDGQTAGGGTVLDVEGAFDGPIVRQIQGAPRRIVEGGLLGAGGFGFEEFPILVE